MMLNKHYVLYLLLLVGSGDIFAQTGSDTKQKQLEDMRKQLQEDQKTIQQQQEWNNQSSQQEIKKLHQENQQKNVEIQVTKQEAQQAKDDVLKAKQELQSKQSELAQTQKAIDSAKNQLATTQSMLQEQEMMNKRIKEEKQRQEDSLKIQTLMLANQQVELDMQKAKNKLFILAIALALSLVVVVTALFLIRQRGMKALSEKNVVIEEERKRSDDLLRNILPAEVMQELKTHGKTQARNYARATVLFADIKDFTTISEQLSPDELIEGLDMYFERFDKVIEKYEIEKIKTIGDAYVCAGGVPTKSMDNPHLVVQAAIDFGLEIDKLRKERLAKGKMPFEFRTGIHTGQLVAGVVGIRKFAYDIWGDTVNMAARMQQASEPGKINISGATYELVKDRFACVYRGKIEAKNKGEIDMYFVEKPIGMPLSAN